jgi:hypothetical protein
MRIDSISLVGLIIQLIGGAYGLEAIVAFFMGEPVSNAHRATMAALVIVGILIGPISRRFVRSEGI